MNNRIYTILAVDDNLPGLYVTSKVLKVAGFNVMEASRGSDALEKVKKCRPDVILLDVKLPDLSGFEVCRLIKSNPLTAATPVIHISATYLDEGSKVTGLEMGADAYLTHPVEPTVLVATIRAMLRIKKAEANYQEAALQWKTTFDSLKDGICLIDESGKINRCNKAAEEIFGIPRNELILSGLCKAGVTFCKYDNDFFIKNFEQNVSGDIEEIFFRERYYQVSINQLQNNGNYTGTVFKLSDISKSKKNEEEMKRLLADLRRSNEELEQFAYVVSHDLQEPLRMVYSYTNLLAKKYKSNLDEEADQFISFITDGMQRMFDYIHDLLGYSKVITKSKEFQRIDTNKVLDDVLQNLSLYIKEQEADIHLDNLPEVAGDKVQLIQLFQNLITNAIKFRSEKKPVISIGAKENSGEWIFHVSDNGIGINSEFYKRIFQMFQRLHERDKYPGTGIGLSVCQRIVERHGGRIWVESEQGVGSTFYFSLPIGGDRIG